MPELGLGPFALAGNLCPQPQEMPFWGPRRVRWVKAALRAAGTVWSESTALCVRGERLQSPVTSFVFVPPPCRSQPGLGEGVAGADIPQLPFGAGRGAPAGAVAGQQLRLQLRLGAGAMTAGAGAMTAGAAARHGHLSPEPPAGTGSRRPPLHPPFAVKTDAHQLQLGHRQRGNLERRLPRGRG